ncbi:hypothetical protein [Aquibacillus kalidii]|uniref:hypothetical protein n=1 Tax=Aquibacillus kalidii TaxID=2762597 RepID=UPI001C992FD0|nr:hypothetical protein [Aquibacillus kalidii]
MKSKKLLITATVIMAIILASSIYFKRDISVIKYFPIDETTVFSTFGTELGMLSETDQDEYDLEWKVFSSLEKKIYLRQDVSLLFSDGRLKGIQSKWKENENALELKSSIHGEDSSHFETISFHHGEIHYPDDQIKSIHEMSHDELYVIDSPHSPLESFEQPDDSNQTDWKETLDHATQQQLGYHWKQLIDHFQIPEDKYIFTPLTDIYKYEKEVIPGISQEKTDQVIGQLWEGLYKNYILGISNTDKPAKSFVPLILFDKKGKHLIVLYQDQNGQKQQLIQYYPTASSNR